MSPSRARWTFPQTLAHRGGGALAPENTLAGLRLASKLGYCGVEFDVKLSADNVPILMHDDTLQRTTSGSGLVSQARFSEIATLDAGTWFGPAFQGERVPTLEAVASVCKGLSLWANIEIKPCPGREAETGRAVALTARRLWEATSAPPLLSSFSRVALAAAQLASPELPRGLLVEAVPGDWGEALAQLGCLSLHVHHEHAGADLVAAMHGAGYALLCYTVNDPQRAAALRELGVDCIVTDRLDLIPPD